MILSFNELKTFKPKKDTYFVFGDPINHSLSPKLHSIYFKNNDVNAEYYAVNIKKEELEEAVKIVKPYAKGVNLTIPHKKAVIPFLDGINEEAEKIGAVNTLKFNDGKVTGYNTDYNGILLTLKKFDFNLTDKSVLILGNGGVAEAFLYTSLKFTSNITVCGRNMDKLKEFCKNTPAVCCLSIEDKKFDVVFNATPLGMGENARYCPVKKENIKNFGFVFDSVYNPLNTNLTVFSDIYNKTNTNGLYMLIYQGLKAQEIWGNSFSDNDAEIIYSSLKDSFSLSQKNIVLTGYMGSGKTTVGKELSKITGRIFVDTDKLIEETEDMSISEIFEKYGEDYFRELEMKMVEKVSRLNGTIISTGGGVIKNQINIKHLKNNGEIFFLNPDFSEIVSRISKSTTRPLIKNKVNMEKLYKERLPVYLKYADYIIDKNTSEESVGEILEITKK